MRGIMRTLLGLAIVAAAALAIHHVSGEERAAVCPASRCPALNGIHGDIDAFGVNPRQPHDSAPQGVCPYSGRSAARDIDRV